MNEVLFASLLVWSVDALSLSFPKSGVSLGAIDWLRYLAASVTFTLAIPMVFSLPLLVLTDHESEKVRKWGPIGLFGLLGGLWQAAALDGDGVRALPYFAVLQIAGWVIGPLLVLGIVHLSLRSRREGTVYTHLFITFAFWCLALAVASLPSLRGYQSFLGFCLLGCVATTTWALGFWPARKPLNRAGALLLFVGLSSTIVPDFLGYQRLSQRYSAVAAAYLKLPVARWVEQPADGLFSREITLTPKEVKAFRSELARTTLPSPEKKRGKNVLLIVLEATRADAWGDPKVAPRFHDWKKAGVYFPRAIAQYPATPLAYGALFVAQPPAVLAQTPAWVTTRPFLALEAQFQHTILSRPNNRWFEKTTVTDFFAPKGTVIHEHPNAEGALDYLRRELEQIGDESFFAWTHLYEAHDPWEPRLNYLGDQKGARGAYLSEVSYVDAKLGQFMEWFLTQPQAQETLVIVYGDHGEGLGEIVEGQEFLGHHVHTRNLVTHVPAFFSGPGIEPNRVETVARVQQLDIIPTLYDFLGVRMSDDSLIQGASLYFLLKNHPTRDLVSQAFGIRGSAFFRYLDDVPETSRHQAYERFQKISASGKYAPNVSLERGDDKIIQDLLLGKTKLFNIKTDPEEQEDLGETDPKRLNELRDRLRTWSRKQSWIIKEMEKGSLPSKAQ